MQTNELLTVEETAEFLQCSRAHVYRLADQNQLPVVRLGNVIRISRRGLESMIDAAIANVQKDA